MCARWEIKKQGSLCYRVVCVCDVWDSKIIIREVSRDSFNRDPRQFLFNRSPTSFVYRASYSILGFLGCRTIFRGRSLVVTYLLSIIHSPHPSIHSHSIHHYFGPRPAHGAQKFLEGSTVFPRFSFFLSSLWKKRVVFLSFSLWSAYSG